MNSHLRNAPARLKTWQCPTQTTGLQPSVWHAVSKRSRLIPQTRWYAAIAAIAAQRSVSTKRASRAYVLASLGADKLSNTSSSAQESRYLPGNGRLEGVHKPQLAWSGWWSSWH